MVKLESTADGAIHHHKWQNTTTQQKTQPQIISTITSEVFPALNSNHKR